MAAWSSICWENNLWAAVSAAPCPAPPAGGKTPNPLVQRRPQAARHQTPVARAASCRLARALGRARGRGASGPPSGGRGQPKENHGRAPDRGPPPPRRRAAGGAPPGEVGLGAGGARTQARPPTPRPGGHSQRPGHRHHGRAPRRGGCGPPHPGGQQRDRTQADHGPGPDKAGPLRWGGGGRAGPVPARPAPDRPHTFAGPARHLWGRAGHRHGGGPGRRALQRPRQRPGRGAPGRPHTEQGPSLPVVGRRGGKKKCREACPPPAGHDWTKKKCGEDALSPPLAVIADTRFPPVRRNSPKRTLCRPVPYALVMRPPPGLRSCVP